MLGQTLNATKVLDDDTDDDSVWEVDLESEQSMVNLTQAVTTVNMVRQDFKIGHSRIWNEGGIAKAFTRDHHITYRTTGTNFDFDFTRP